MRKIVSLVIVVLPYALMRIGWSEGGSIWFYWGSDVYVSLVSLIIGLACIFFPYQVDACLQGKSASALAPQLLEGYKTNGFIALLVCILNSWLTISSYIRCPSIICV
jgi:hypothetical protein